MIDLPVGFNPAENFIVESEDEAQAEAELAAKTELLALSKELAIDPASAKRRLEDVFRVPTNIQHFAQIRLGQVPLEVRHVRLMDMTVDDAKCIAKFFRCWVEYLSFEERVLAAELS